MLICKARSENGDINEQTERFLLQYFQLDPANPSEGSSDLSVLWKQLNAGRVMDMFVDCRRSSSRNAPSPTISNISPLTSVTPSLNGSPERPATRYHTSPELVEKLDKPTPRLPGRYPEAYSREGESTVLPTVFSLQFFVNVDSTALILVFLAFFSYLLVPRIANS